MSFFSLEKTLICPGVSLSESIDECSEVFIIFIISGSASLKFNEKNILIKESSYCFYRGDSSDISFSCNSNFYILSIDTSVCPSYLNDYILTLPDRFYGILNKEDSDNIILFLDKLSKNSFKDNSNVYRTSAYLITFIGDLYDRCVCKDDNLIRRNERMKGLAEYINKSYDQQITLTEAAEHTGLCAAYLCEIFPQAFGCTFSEYLTKQRVGAVKRMLETTNDSISDIAFSCGFGSLSSFSRSFKNYCGMSASKYRRLYLQKET